jgi:hypothetical protein
MTSIGQEIKSAAAAVEHEASVLVHATGSELVKLYLEVLGSEGYKAFTTAAEELLKQEAGQIIRNACLLAGSALKSGSGAAIRAFAAALSLEALKQAGLTVSEALLNLAIELIVNGGKVGAVTPPQGGASH